MLRLVSCVAMIAASISTAAGQNDHRTWKEYGGGPDNSKFVDLNQITKANVNKLTVAWEYPTRDAEPYLFNPIVVGNVMYVLARGNSLVALDATTGREIWIHAHLPGIGTRGISFWESKDHKDQRLIFQINHYIEEIDARTGKSILTFGDRGLVDLREGLSRAPETVTRIRSNTPGRVFENLIIMGSATGESYMSPPGDLRAYNVITGKMAWVFHTIPHPGEPGYETWPKDAWKYIGGTNTWGEITLDEKSGILYFPTGSPTYDMYGADRTGKNLYGDCLLAINARTGTLIWYFQDIHHDLWDYDLTSAPQLISIRHNGKEIQAVAQAGKDGFLYVFDRYTGKPVWPIEERLVPQSDVPGEHSWPTQPFPTAPPPFARQTLTANDIDPYLMTPEERAIWKKRVAGDNNQGLFTPPSATKETVEMPGARGGSNWGTTAANPDKGLVYVLTQDWPSFIPKVAERSLPRAGGQYGASATGKQIFTENCQSCHGTNRQGSAVAPALTDLFLKLNLDDFEQILKSGKGEMPAFSGLSSSNAEALYSWLVNPDNQHPQRPGASAAAISLDGPVVASGGAPGGLSTAGNPNAEAQKYGGNFAGPPYPKGVTAPPRMYSDYGLDFPYVVSPPWSSIVAYDLNSGTIKWKEPLGDDQVAAREGAKDSGVEEGGERRGIIVTSTGLLFVNCKDGKVRAFDAETGKVLWTTDLTTGTEGIPAMYEVNGREYLVVPASSPLKLGLGPNGAQTNPGTKQGYMVFALPN
ncbi:PQQ-binding-like beta-propeller repeat protein [Paracidobacterium acidisoli]|nr:PQQ-binding-like beta-propeller repeat protein [Paracidobacterium acidisoli]MBT9332326.1 PQQ-binding-like beta-propeller repeat protein [Paracidobacterium acidisoli]